MDPATGQEKEILSRRTRIAPPMLLSQGRSDRVQSTSGGWRATVSSVLCGWARGPASHPGRTGAEHRAAVVRRWSLALFLPAASRQNRSARFPWRVARVRKSRLWTFSAERSAQVDPQGRAIVYTIVEGGQAKATIVRDLALRQGAHTGSHDRTVLVGHRIPRPSSATTRPRIPAATSITDGMLRHARPMGGLPHSHERLSCHSVPRRVPPVLHPRHRCRSEHARIVDVIRRRQQPAQGRNHRTAPAGRLGIRRLADKSNRLHQVEREPARAVAGELEVGRAPLLCRHPTLHVVGCLHNPWPSRTPASSCSRERWTC